MKHIALITLAIVILVPVGFAVCFKTIPAGTIGVRQSKWGGGGISLEDFSFGIRWGVTGVHQWHYLPMQTHFLHFTGGRSLKSKTFFASSGGAVEDFYGPLEIRTKDNNTVSIDVSIPYRIQPGKGHKIVEKGLKTAYRTRVKGIVEGILLGNLAKLTSEDLQSTTTRLEQAQSVMAELNRELAQYYVEAEIVLIRSVSFPDAYEERLQQKQYLRQLSRLDQAKAVQNEEEREVQEIEAQTKAAQIAKEKEWDKRLQEEKSRYQVLIQEIKSDAALYVAQTEAGAKADRVIAEAEGQLALEKALALRDELRNAALASKGGRILLALEAVDNLNVPEVTLNSDDPAVPMLLDIGSMSKLLVGESEDSK